MPRHHDTNIILRISKEEKETIEADANARGVSASAHLRDLARWYHNSERVLVRIFGSDETHPAVFVNGRRHAP